MSKIKKSLYKALVITVLTTCLFTFLISMAVIMSLAFKSVGLVGAIAAYIFMFFIASTTMFLVMD